jgi:hypothetical protein
MADSQTLFDTLAGSFGHGVDRPQLNAFVANSQASNGLRTAQTDEALNNAQLQQEELQAHSRLKDSLLNLKDDAGNPMHTPSQADLVLNTMLGKFGSYKDVEQGLHQAMTNRNKDVLSNPNKLGTADQTAAQQGIQGKVAEPTALPNNFTTLPGTAPVNPQQSAQGAAQTAQTKALTGADIERAELEHAQALKASRPAGTGSLDPGTLDDAASVVMADPSKMSQYAGFGQSGQANKDGINNAISSKLNAAGMTASDMIRQRALAKASVGSAGAAAKQAETLDAFTPLVRSNGDRIMQILNTVNDDGGDVPIIAGLERASGRAMGSDDLAELHSVFGTYQNEVARLLASSPTMNGVISDKARGDVQAMAPENMTTGQARRVINRINTEISLRRQGVQTALDSATGAQLPVTDAGRTSATPGAGPAPAAPPGAMTLDDYLTRQGFPAKK